MSSLTDLRSQLEQSRAVRDSAAQQLATLSAQLKKTQQQISQAQRLGSSQSGPLAALQKTAQTLSTQVSSAQGSVSRSRANVNSLLGQLSALGDPTQLVGQLEDSIPILLFPLRIEVRFRSATATAPAAGTAPGVGTAPGIGTGATAGAPAGAARGAALGAATAAAAAATGAATSPAATATGAATANGVATPGSPQLWVRIYPDDCQIDGFEAMLSDSELSAAQAFWIATWRSGGVEGQARGAWRTLVGALGSGRAAYVISQFAPGSAAAPPTKTNPQDVVLVIVPQTTVTAAEQAAAFTYWQAVWAANGDATKAATALAAFQGAVGSARAAVLVQSFAPDPNGWDPPKPYTRAQVAVSCALLPMPAPPTTKQSSWTTAPKAVALPDRFVVLAYQGGVEVQRVFGNRLPDTLDTTPDPSLPAADQLRVNNGDLQLNDDLKWLADFDQAVAVGMGVKLDLTPAQAQQGFDRLLVLGVRTSSDANASADLLSGLISHQASSKSGYSLVPQGSPAHNTDSGTTGYSWVDDPDTSYDTIIKGADAYVPTSDPLARRDGQWLAEALGVDASVIQRLPHAAGVDQLEARAMNIALWNGTAGYILEEMLTPIFSAADIGATRDFFTRFVSGRGPLPAVRVGNQPYGVLPAMAFSRYAAASPTAGRGSALPAPDYLKRLQALLTRMDVDWRNLSSEASYVGQPGDPDQALLDVVGLHSGSVEYSQRFAESFDQLYNKLVLELGQSFGTLLASWLSQQRQTLLSALGANPASTPPLLEKFFYGADTLLTGPVVDDRPLSETQPIRAYTPDNKNYVQWLMAASLDAIRQEDFGGNAQPTALLYLLLRHAMMLCQWDAGTRFLEANGLSNATGRLEPSFIGIQNGALAGQSKFQKLFEPQPAITGSPTMPLAEYVLSAAAMASPENSSLREVVSALGTLALTPTSRLERLFAEHVDCCSYRLDAWKMGIVATRLSQMRTTGVDQAPPKGIYLGAFGWLEGLKPKGQTLSPAGLEGDLSQTFQRPTDAPLVYDPTNAGFIHAPSLGQAAAAAILRNAYRLHASPANPDAMSVNLRSDRVRDALTILEGVRNGQTLSALLGYRFERGLHDDYALAEVDKFIYPLRQAFPLVANQLQSTATDGTVDITLLEARNVIDGVGFATRLRSAGNAVYPFGLTEGTGPGQIPNATPAEESALNTEADNLLNLYDALADLVLAESVYQVVLGNFDRAAANTKAFNQGGHPPEIEVVKTPRRGLSLTHRLALQLDSSADPAVSPSPVPMTPRAKAEAPLNLWLSGRLPPPDSVAVSVSYTTPTLSAPKTAALTLTDLQLQPLDLLYLFNLDLDQATSELDDRIFQRVRYGPDAHPDITVTINYMQPLAGKVSFFECAALVRSLRTLILKSRPLGPTDLQMPLESKTDDSVWDDAQLSVRIQQAASDLTSRRDALVALETDASDLDTYAQKVSVEQLKVALYGIPQTGTGATYAKIRSLYEAVVAKVQVVVNRWTQNAADYTALMGSWAGLTNDPDRFAMLAKAERLIAARPTLHPPTDPNVYKTNVEVQKPGFDADLNQLQALLSWSGSKWVDYLAAVTAAAGVIPAHDLQKFDLSDQVAASTALRAQLVTRVTVLANDLTSRISDVTAAVAAVATVEASADRVAQLSAAAKRVLGAEALLLPRFTLSTDAGTELSNAFGGSAGLLADLTAAGRRFPMDDWLYGVARARSKVGAWENVVLLSEGFGAAIAELTPVQLPYQANDRWTALEFDTTAVGTQAQRLLYTAHFAVPFNPGTPQCGLLLDEWSELVPDSEVMSGLTFHFDRPRSQPPQTMLLAVPPALRGNWQWDDLVATLHETLDAAKSRAVEPAQIDTSSYAQILPATLMAVTLYPITIATNLMVNDNIYQRMAGA